MDEDGSLSIPHVHADWDPRLERADRHNWQYVLRRTGVTKPLVFLSFIIVLWLVGVALLADIWVTGTALLIPGLAVLALCLRYTLKDDWGPVAAWPAFSLVSLGCLAVVSRAHVHLHEFTRRRSACDAMAETCGPQVPQGIVHALPLCTFVAAGIATLRLIATVRRRDETLAGGRM
jgi:hypothetical protein